MLGAGVAGTGFDPVPVAFTIWPPAMVTCGPPPGPVADWLNASDRHAALTEVAWKSGDPGSSTPATMVPPVTTGFEMLAVLSENPSGPGTLPPDVATFCAPVE